MKIRNWLEKTFINSFKKEWYETYWAFDIHGVIIRPDYKYNSKTVDFYPNAKECLQLLSKRQDIVLIMFTSSYPQEIDHYLKVFNENNIHFKYVNENPEITSINGNFGFYEKKFYFNILFEDKAGFDAEEDWHDVLQFLKWCEYTKFLPNPDWSTKK